MRAEGVRLGNFASRDLAMECATGMRPGHEFVFHRSGSSYGDHITTLMCVHKDCVMRRHIIVSDADKKRDSNEQQGNGRKKRRAVDATPFLVREVGAHLDGHAPATRKRYVFNTVQLEQMEAMYINDEALTPTVLWSWNSNSVHPDCDFNVLREWLKRRRRKDDAEDKVADSVADLVQLSRELEAASDWGDGGDLDRPLQ